MNCLILPLVPRRPQLWEEKQPYCCRFRADTDAAWDPRLIYIYTQTSEAPDIFTQLNDVDCELIIKSEFLIKWFRKKLILSFLVWHNIEINKHYRLELKTWHVSIHMLSLYLFLTLMQVSSSCNGCRLSLWVAFPF